MDDRTLARFMAKVEISGEHWLWTASRFPTGYGEFWFQGSMRRAHRVSYMHFVGPVPQDWEVCHRDDLCPFKHCVRPEHLYAGTHSENMQDAITKGVLDPARWIDNRGERHGMSKLTETEVRAIRADTRPGVVIAREHGISQMTVSNIRNRKSWRHLD